MYNAVVLVAFINEPLFEIFQLLVTKAEDKLQNINDAVQVFEDWLKNFEKLDLSKENRAYLPLATIQTLISLKKKYSIENEKAERFLADYKSAGGDYKHLRTIASAENESSWDIVRNSNLKEILKRNEDDDADLWDDELPTKEHMELILWAYSPDATKIKKNLAKLSDLLDKDKSEESDNEENEEIETKGSKRKSDSSSSEDETPKKKSKK